MILITSDKEYWTTRGWTVEACDKRLAECRAAAKDFRTFPDHTRYSYRMLNANQYRKLKTLRGILAA